MARELVICEGSKLKELPFRFIYSSDSLRKVTFCEGLETIGQQAFQDCHSLSETSLPSSLTTIEEGAFEGCGFRTIVLPANLETIGRNCYNQYLQNQIESIYSNNPQPPYCSGVWRLSLIPSSTPVYIPKGSLEAYRENIGWRYFSNFIETEGTPSGLDEISVEGNTATVRIENGMMMIETDSTTDYSVYQSDGRLVKYGRVSAPGLSLELPSGLYVVKAGSTVSKIVL